MQPKVSVVMSVYNGEKYLREAIESILNQTFTDFEFLIIDDSSTDSTSAILAEYLSRDSRLIVIRNDENIGLTRSLNKGLALARGEYIARQDADDISLPERLRRQVKLMDNHSDIILVASNYEIIDAHSNHIETRKLTCEPDLIAWYLLFFNYIGGHGVVMFRREQVINLGAYAEEFRYAQDYQLWLRLVNVGNIAVLPETLLQWRCHEQGISVKALSDQTEYALMATQCHLNQLTGVEFNLDQINELKIFWLGLPVTDRQVKDLHIHLQIIYRAFLGQRSKRGYNTQKLSSQLRFLISKRLLYSARSSDLKKMLWLKLMVLPYAFAWHPLGVLDYWLKVFWKVLMRRTVRPV